MFNVYVWRFVADGFEGGSNYTVFSELFDNEQEAMRFGVIFLKLYLGQDVSVGIVNLDTQNVGKFYSIDDSVFAFSWDGAHKVDLFTVDLEVSAIGH